MARTEGRGGMPSLKSGQRVEGFSKVEPFVLARMLHGEEERLVVGREGRAADLGAGRRLVRSSACSAAAGPARVGAIDAVGEARRVVRPSVAIQMRPLRIEGDVVGRGEPAVVASPGAVIARAVRRIAGLAAEQEEGPGASVAAWSCRPSAAARSRGYGRSGCWARGLAGLTCVGLALLVVGQHDIDAAVHRIGLDVLRPVHRRGA